MSTSSIGLLLAAGAGHRIGGPKALRHDPDGTSWLLRSVEALRDGGCEPVVVVLGADADAATALLAETVLLTEGAVQVVVARKWSQGMGESLRAGLEALTSAATDDAVAIVTLVDLPDVGPDLVARLRDAAGDDPTALARATYDGRPGHPVAIGRVHWQPLAEQVHGDEGARGYLKQHGAAAVECADLATGEDIDELPSGPSPA